MSEVSATALDLTKKVVTAVMTSRTDPSLTVDLVKGSGDFQSRKINATLTGRISKMCVYWSSCQARANEEVSGPHQIAREIAVRMLKTRNGDNFASDSRLVLLGTV